MRFAPLLPVLASITALVEGAPYSHNSRGVQRSKRRAADRSLSSHGVPAAHAVAAPELHKRSVPYSVVPVDGGSPTAGGNAPVEPTTVYDTVVSTATAAHTKFKPTTIYDTVLSTVVSYPPAETIATTQTQYLVTTDWVPVTQTVVRTQVMTRTHKAPGTTISEMVFVTTTEIETTRMPPKATTESETQTKIKTIVSTLAPATETTAPTEQTVWETAAPVTQTIIKTASPVTKSTTKSAPTVTKSFTESAQVITESVTQSAPAITKSVTQPASPITYSITETAAQVTETTVPAAPTTTQTTYDNGQWHPPYPKTTLPAYPLNSSTSALAYWTVPATSTTDVASPTITSRFNSFRFNRLAERVSHNRRTASPPLMHRSQNEGPVKRDADYDHQSEASVEKTRLTKKELRRRRRKSKQ